MDLSSIIIGAIFLAAFILPFIWMGIRRKKEEKKNILSFQQYALEQNETIVNIDVMEILMIAFNVNKSKLYFAFKDGESWNYHHINTNEISSVKVNRVSSAITTTNGTKDLIKKLQLNLYFKHKDLPFLPITFYNQQVSMEINDELILLNKWVLLLK
ncbi:MAG: hypothetical protein MH472_07465 [Bacteroidia bacterium]|nr:hypothetical protein [Bacteroidia bacterium]